MCFQSAWIEQKRGEKTVKYCVINQCRILTQNEYFPHKRSVSKAFQMRVWRYKHPSTKCVQFNLLLYRLHINKEVITCIINAAGFGWAISFKAGLAAFKRCPVVEFVSLYVVGGISARCKHAGVLRGVWPRRSQDRMNGSGNWTGSWV